MDQQVVQSRSRDRVRVLIGGCLAAGVLGLTAAASAQPIPIVVSGQQVPGFPPETVFAGFSDPRVMPNGAVIFWAKLQGPTIMPEAEQSLWLWGGSEPQLIIQSGGPVPWRTNTTLVAMALPIVDAQGSIVFAGAVADADVTTDGSIDEAHNAGVFSLGGDGLLRVLAQKGAPMPGLPAGEVLGDPGAVGLNAAGMTAFAAGDGSAMWTVQLGADPVLAAMTGDSYSTLAGDTGTLDRIDEPIVTATGRLVFRASEAGADVLETRRALIELGSAPGSTLRAKLHTGDVGLARQGSIVRDLGLRGVAFADGNGVRWEQMDRTTPATDTGLGATDTQSNFPRRVVQEGSVVADELSLVVSRIDPEIHSNAAPEIVFLAWLEDAADGSPRGQGIFRHNTNLFTDAQLLIKTGDQAPDQPAGVTVRFLEQPMITDAPTVIVPARVQGPGVIPETARMLVAIPDLGPARSVVREGDTIATGPGGSDHRTVRSFAFVPSNSGDGQASTLDRAPIVQLEFTDASSGLFLISVDPLDFSNDGLRDGQDFFAFLEALEAHDPRADLTGNDAWNVNDYLFFLDHF